ncbi:hypothetical protein GUU_04214, partial [Malacoplasma iowae 695]
ELSFSSHGYGIKQTKNQVVEIIQVLVHMDMVSKQNSNINHFFKLIVLVHMDMVSKQNLSTCECTTSKVLVHMDMVSKQNQCYNKINFLLF